MGNIKTPRSPGQSRAKMVLSAGSGRAELLPMGFLQQQGPMSSQILPVRIPPALRLCPDLADAGVRELQQGEGFAAAASSLHEQPFPSVCTHTATSPLSLERLFAS